MNRREQNGHQTTNYDPWREVMLIIEGRELPHCFRIQNPISLQKEASGRGRGNEVNRKTLFILSKIVNKQCYNHSSTKQQSSDGRIIKEAEMQAH